MYGGLRNRSVCFDLLYKQRSTSTSHFVNTGSRSTSVALEWDVFASRTGSLINEIRSCRVEIIRNRTGATLVAFSG